MAENTRLKDLDTNIKRILDIMEKRDQAYSDRFTQIEKALETLAMAGSNSTSTTGTSQPFQVRNIKLDFPRFNGTDVLQWIFKAEQFFDYYSTPDPQRLTVASVHLDKEVVPWFQMMNRTNPFRSWGVFTRALELEFGPSPFACSRSTLFKLSQNGSVNEYYLEFTALANRVSGISADALLDCFISGLKADIRRDVIAQDPLTLLKAVALAKLYEEKYTTITKSYFPNPYPKYLPQNTSANLNTNHIHNFTPAILPTPAQKPFNQPLKPSNIKKISPAEMQLRREKGLCYTCDDKFTLNHRCPNKQYLLLQVEELDDPLLDPDPPDPFIDHEVHYNPEHHLSFNALNGSSGLGTMRFQGSINGVSVQILLDSGSSDNFLQPRLAHHLQLPIELIPTFQVLVGNGNCLVVEGLVKDVKVSVQGHTLRIPVYLLHVSGADVVLGAAWLATLGPHVSDYSALTLRFYLEGDFITLHGVKSTLPSQAQFHHIRRLCNTHAIAALYTLQFQSQDIPHDQGLDSPADIHPDLSLLLSTYSTVFAKPHGLPPDRTLNTITIKDTFPIPTEDELLDELFGATYFSKLDLHSGYHQILVSPEDMFKQATFQILMNFVFQGLLRKSVLFFYDTLVYNPSWSSHLQHLEAVIHLLQHHPLFAKLSKYQFGLPQSDYLGHTVSGNGVHHPTATWEDLSSIQVDYPNFNLEDKVDFYGGGNVMNKGESVANEVHGKSVIPMGQVYGGEANKGNRNSEKKRSTNSMLKDYM